jgi:hypothetical protein
MFKLFSWLAIVSASLFLACLGAGPAEAASQVTFVSGKGFDTGACADPAHPCRTFQFALGQTAPSGEVKALDPAEYGPMNITQSVSITGVEGASIVPDSNGNVIEIAAGPDDAVNLSHLILDAGIPLVNLNVGRAIRLDSGGSLTVTHCTVRNGSSDGAIALFAFGGTTNVLFEDVSVAHNDGNGIHIAGFVRGAFDTVTAFNNSIFGITIELASLPAAKAKTRSNEGAVKQIFAPLLAFASYLAGDHAAGVALYCPSPKCPPLAKIAPAAHTGVLWLYDSDVSQNKVNGLFLDAGAPAESAGNNFIHGNGTDIGGPGSLTEVGTD